MPVGALKMVLELGQTNAGPVIEQPGSGLTVRTMSLVTVQPLVSTAVNRKVAVAEETCAVVSSELGESIVAIPEITLQAVEATGCRPAVATPCSGKAVESPSVQRA